MNHPEWRDIAIHYPEFVQWVVATYGPLPDGLADRDEVERLSKEYNAHLSN